jgi:hypothetical protein
MEDICSKATDKVAIVGDDFKRGSNGFMFAKLSPLLSANSLAKIVCLENDFRKQNKTCLTKLKEASDLVFLDDWILSAGHFNDFIRLFDFLHESNSKIKGHSMVIAGEKETVEIMDRCKYSTKFVPNRIYNYLDLGITLDEIDELTDLGIFEEEGWYLTFIILGKPFCSETQVFLPDNASSLISKSVVQNTLIDWPFDSSEFYGTQNQQEYLSNLAFPSPAIDLELYNKLKTGIKSIVL